MVVWALAAASALALPVYAGETGSTPGRMASPGPLPSEAPIQITINPEGRVSVTLGGDLPPPARHGTHIEFRIAIVNQGFVTSRLEAQMVGDPPASATLDFHPAPLTGVPRETRTLRITLPKAGQTDLTIAFRLHNETPDLGGRDRIHLLLRSS